MENIVSLVLFVAFVSVMVILPITGIADAARRPKSQFEGAGQNKTAWIAMMATFVLCGLPGCVSAALYWATIRPKLGRVAPPEPISGGG